MSTVTCTECPKTFTKDDRLKADQALRMHVARVHDKTIDPRKPKHKKHEHAHSGVVHLHANANGGPPRKIKGKLTWEESQSVIGFIQSRRGEFASKQACFTAALEHAGVDKKIRNNSVAVQRYFQKAEKVPSANGKPAKRRYNKRQKVVEMPVAKTINFCSQCGQNIKAQAIGSVIAEQLAAGAVVTINGEKVQYA